MNRIQVDPQAVRQLCPELMLVGPFTKVEFEDVYVRPTDKEQLAIRSMRAWTDTKVAGLNIDRSRKQLNVVEPIEIDADGKLRIALSREGFDYGHFAATSTHEDFEKCYKDYHAWVVTTRQSGGGLSREKFERCCRHRMPANAILAVTADGMMLWVRRKREVFLHPEYLHTLGITLNVDDDTAEAGLYRCLKQEANVEPLDVDADSIRWVGVSDNEPQHQPILLGLVQLLLSTEEVEQRLPQAIRPDGRGVFYRYERGAFEHLLSGDELVTPSGRVFAYLMLEGLKQGILPQWR